jgi:hypothetical protein
LKRFRVRAFELEPVDVSGTPSAGLLGPSFNGVSFGRAARTMTLEKSVVVRGVVRKQAFDDAPMHRRER